MPGKVTPYFTALLLQQLAGESATAATLYIGLQTDDGTEIAGAGYARIAFPAAKLAASTYSDPMGSFYSLILFSNAKFPVFTGTPSPNGATHWILTDSPTGAGNQYASGPLNPGFSGGTLRAAAAQGTKTLMVGTGQCLHANLAAQNLQLYDHLALGTTCAGNAERVQVVAIGQDNGSGLTALTLAAPTASAHPAFEPFAQDGATRYYAVGFQEIVSAQVTFAAVPPQ